MLGVNLEKVSLTALAVMVVLAVPRVQAKDYYIDSQKDFEAINQVTLVPGDAILLKRGMSFRGMLSPKGNGDEGAVVRISTYGRGSRPKIHAGGKHQAGGLLRNPSCLLYTSPSPRDS